MSLIFTTLGMMDVDDLEKREGVVDTDQEHTTWTEYWFEGALVKRSVHIALKRGLDILPIAQSLTE